MDIVRKYRNILYFILISVFIFAMIGLFFDKEGDGFGPSLLSSGRGVEAVDIAERELLSILLDLRKIELRESIFVDSVFRSLQDFSQELVPEPVGRRNPFTSIFVE